MTLSDEKNITAAFTGYRPEKIILAGTYEQTEQNICDSVKTAVSSLYGSGYRIFMSGMARGFDLIAARAVVELKEELEGLRLFAVLPFAARGKNREVYEVTRKADKVICISVGYHDACFMLRNDYLVDNASVIICYFDGVSGGTAYTVKYAARKGKRIINLCPEAVTEQVLF